MSIIRRCYASLLRRAAPLLDARDIDEACADFERARRAARGSSLGAWLRCWARECSALASTWHDERRRRRMVFETADGKARWGAAVLQDLSHAARGMVRQKRFATVVAATLALGIGANGAMLTLLDRLLLRGPAHVQDAAHLVRVYRRVTRPVAGAQTSAWLPYETYRHLAERAQAFSSIGGYGVRDTVVGSGPAARMRRVGLVLGAFFETLGSRPAMGRTFGPEEDAAVAGPLAILSDQLWQSDFGASPTALGSTLVVDGAPAVIIGIMPPGFSGPETGRVDAWILGSTRTASAYNWRVVGRLRSHVSRQAASANVAAVHARTADDEPKWMGDTVLYTAPIRFDDTGREPVDVQIARWVAAVAAMILFVTCANVATLFIVRFARRRREFGIRVALGSGTARVVRLVAFEGLLLAAAAAVASVGVARFVLAAARTAFVTLDPEWTSSSLDGRFVWITAVTALIAAAAITIVPAFHVARQPTADALRERSGAGPARTRVRAALTVVQAAVSLVLLAGAGLFLVSLRHVAALPLGTEPDRVLVVEARLSRPPVPQGRAEFQRFVDDLRGRERELYERTLESVRRLNGVASAAITLGLPLDNGSFTTTLRVPGLDAIPPLPGGGPYLSAVGDDYFATIGTRIVRGRPFDTSDGARSEAVAIVSATTAARLWPDRDALGRCVFVGARRSCARVVGVAEDVHRVGLREEPSLQVYVPFGQEQGIAGARLLIRTSPGGDVPLAELRQAVGGDATGTEYIDVHRLSESLEGELRPLHIGAVTFGASAALAVLTASLGLYGLMAYVVAWRRREIGVRLALGASDAQIRRLVAGNGLVTASIGVAIGVTVVLRCGRWIQPLLFETSASDARVLAAASAGLLLIAALAGLAPCRRALRIAPSETIRAE